MNTVELQVGANYDFLDREFDWDKSKNQEKQIFSLRGGGGSGKTFDALHFIITYCDNYYGWNKSITIGRDQYSDVKKTVLKDFINILKENGIYNIKNHGQSHPQTYRLYGNLINFTGFYGLGAHGERNHLVFANEILESDWENIRPLNQRCSELFMADYNPMFTDHWHYDKMESRADCKLFHSTQLMNPFLPEGERNEILAYEPWAPGSYEMIGETIFYNGLPIDKSNRPPPHPTNIDNGTADEYSWYVYGLGLKSAPEGLIFRNVRYIDEWPQDVGYCYGMDFGFTVDPSTLVKVGETSLAIYLELLMYEPTETPELIDGYMIAKGVDKSKPITADSSDKHKRENNSTIEMVKGLRDLGWNIYKVSKTKGLMYWLGQMRKKPIFIIKNEFYPDAKKEAENYRMKMVNGLSIGQPIDKFNHFWDGCFSHDTMITTNKGQKRIKDINESDYALTSKGFKRVLYKWNNGYKSTLNYCLQFDTFSLSLRCTSNHRVKTSKGWIEISKLMPGAEVYLTNYSMANDINYMPEKGIFQEGREKCTGTFGSFIKARGRKESTYTIRTKTLGTTKSITSNLLSVINIYLTTLKKDIKTILDGLKNLPGKELKPLKLGTKQKRGKPGMYSKRKNMILGTEHMEKGTVKFAGTRLKPKTIIRDSVQTNANHNIEEMKELTTSQKHVNTAVQVGLAINTTKPCFVQKFAVQEIDLANPRYEQVYDLSIEDDHEFFANELLVHNSRYGFMSLNQQTGIRSRVT